jgi:hypothetical protein
VGESMNDLADARLRTRRHGGKNRGKKRLEGSKA